MDDLIRKLSEIRSEYNCFDKDEESYYSALSEVIRILSRCADGDTISRQAAIDTITEYGWGDNVYMSVGNLVGRIEQLPPADVQPVVHWIPWDSGRFPDDSGTYIVTAYDGVQERVTFAKYQKRLKRWELTGARAYWRVLAWMPLPEPYQGKRKGAGE